MPRAKTDSKRINIYIPRKVLSALQVIAEQEAGPDKRGNVSAHIRTACIRYAKEEIARLRAGHSVVRAAPVPPPDPDAPAEGAAV